MNENVDLTKILKDCPKGWKFYSSIHGELLYFCMYLSSSASKITFIKPNKTSMFDGSPISVDYYRDGKYFPNQGECTLFPSKYQRDWSKFTAPWYKKTEWFNPWRKKDKFDPKTLKPFDKVLARDSEVDTWECELLSRTDESLIHKFKCCGLVSYIYCIPYNDDTKHLVGTTNEAPEYYRYWED